MPNIEIESCENLWQHWTLQQHKSTNSSLQSLNKLLNIKEFLYVFQPRLLTMSAFSVAHLKVDASVKFSGDQSVGHDHHQPRDCKQHEQQQDVPEGDMRRWA